jgi:endo-1,4-beta-xylanase
MHTSNRLLVTLAAACLLVGRGPELKAQESPSLKDVFRDAFLVGAALNADQFHERDTLGAALIKQHFNAITPENALKWENVHPEPGTYAFEDADRFVEFGIANDMFIVGHTLVWHNQTPAWVFQNADGMPVSRDTLVNRLRDHIHTVVGRYQGRIQGWDVVNEALNEDGTLRQTPWLRIIGEDYLLMAFQFAHEADPELELYYNDYSLENAPKRDGAVALIKQLQAAGATVHGIGSQAHIKMDWPTPEQQDSTITAFASLGLKVMITELDIDVLPPVGEYLGADITYNVELQDKLNPYGQGLPDEVQQALARRYEQFFRVLMKHRDVISRATFWGVSDADSWLNDWPVRGRTSYPLLFDRSHRPKPAFDAVIRAAQPKSAAAN